MMRGRRCSALVLVTAALALSASPGRGGAALYAQETTASTSPAATPIPKTYAAGTAPSRNKVKDVGEKAWRALVTGAGTFPFAYFYTNFIFDGVRFIENGFDAQYAPWPFKTQYSAEVSVSETFVRLGVSMGISAVVGIIDALALR